MVVCGEVSSKMGMVVDLYVVRRLRDTGKRMGGRVRIGNDDESARHGFEDC